MLKWCRQRRRLQSDEQEVGAFMLDTVTHLEPPRRHVIRKPVYNYPTTGAIFCVRMVLQP